VNVTHVGMGVQCQTYGIGPVSQLEYGCVCVLGRRVFWVSPGRQGMLSWEGVLSRRLCVCVCVAVGTCLGVVCSGVLQAALIFLRDAVAVAAAGGGDEAAGAVLAGFV
jgi:hypothetical protein